MYKKLKEHIGHNIECVSYGKQGDNVSIECMDCNQVLIDYDKPEEKTGLLVIANINIEIPTDAKTEDEAEEEAQNFELPHDYLEDSFEIVKVVTKDGEDLE